MDNKFCPVCKQAVRYVITGNGAAWVHVDSGRSVVAGHDVNTYAPDRLLNREDTA
jgi:hypothetical protein